MISSLGSKLLFEVFQFSDLMYSCMLSVKFYRMRSRDLRAEVDPAILQAAARAPAAANGHY